jgi:uncharacterized protein with NRDE domain
VRRRIIGRGGAEGEIIAVLAPQRGAGLLFRHDPRLPGTHHPRPLSAVWETHRAGHPRHGRGAADAERYDGFNLLLGDLGSAHYFGNRTPGAAAPRRLEPGLYGLSNHLLDTPWPKVARGRRLLAELLDAGAPTAGVLLEILYDTEIAPAHALPDTGVATEWERALSASFIATPTYGTRASTALVVDDARNATFVERTFLPGPVLDGEVRFDLVLAAS